MKKLVKFVRLACDRQLANVSRSRGAVAAAFLPIDLTDPLTLEMSVFSQNGEEGTVDVLLSQLPQKNR